MSRGGYRPGSGRPKGSKMASPTRQSLIGVACAAHNSGLTPLEYMLEVMNSVEADQNRRDRMAIAAAPFCHPRVADNRFGKKDAAAKAAETAGADTDWGDDLKTPVTKQ
jgi:phage terminase small subunit